jgi:hypothetical protein
MPYMKALNILEKKKYLTKKIAVGYVKLCQGIPSLVRDYT